MSGLAKKASIPWLPIILLVVGILFFWVYPAVRGPVKVTVVPAKSAE